MKYFIGITPPEKYSERIKTLQQAWNNNTTVLGTIPHITVKSQSGLDSALSWLNPVMDACRNFGSFNLGIGEPGWFSDRVLFLTVHSEQVRLLHELILNVVNPASELRSQFFEGDAYHAHLTLGMGGPDQMSPAELKEMQRKAELSLSPYPSFEVNTLTVFECDDRLNKGIYSKLTEIPLLV